MHALHHLICRFIGEGYRQNIVRRNVLFSDKIANAVRQKARFATPRPRGYQNNAVGGEKRFLLFLIQRFKVVTIHNKYLNIKMKKDKAKNEEKLWFSVKEIGADTNFLH